MTVDRDKPPSTEVRTAKAFHLPNNQHQEFIFAARQIPKQIREIAWTFPLVAPEFFRKALREHADRPGPLRSCIRHRPLSSSLRAQR